MCPNWLGQPGADGCNLMVGAAGCTLTVRADGYTLKVGAAGCILMVRAAGRGLVRAGGGLRLCPCLWLLLHACGLGFALVVCAIVCAHGSPSPGGAHLGLFGGKKEQD